jgi:hypothetical protein
MNEPQREKRGRNVMKNYGVLLPFLPRLLFTGSITFLRFKRRANKAGKIFRKELIKQGIDKRTALELTGQYLKGSEMKNFIRTFTENSI